MMPTLFRDNPRRADLDLSDAVLRELTVDAAARFDALPLYHRGESSELRRTRADGLLVQRLVPSLNSISQGRKGRVEGTAELRHEISRVFWRALHREGLATCHLACHGDVVLLSEERVPPVEVVVKAALVGTPSRIYHGLLDRTDRFGRRFEAHSAHAPYVRFDYRNPLVDGAGLRDELLPRALADRLIDTKVAQRTALEVFEVVQRRLARVELRVLDACLLFDERGRVLTYEVSPDNMRIKSAHWAGGPDAQFDKDLWREHQNDETLLQRWTELRDRLVSLDD